MVFGLGVYYCLGVFFVCCELIWGFIVFIDCIEDMWFVEVKNDF